jgi:hypothetical protein
MVFKGLLNRDLGKALATSGDFHGASCKYERAIKELEGVGHGPTGLARTTVAM